MMPKTKMSSNIIPKPTPNFFPMVHLIALPPFFHENMEIK
jgi:hypothetical protein